jgi:hypothetical protein
MKKLASYGGAVAVASAGFAGASVALSTPAGAAGGDYCGVSCFLYLTNPSSGTINYQGVRVLTGQTGTVCNVALYQGSSVVVGGAIAQGPQISCVGFNQDENYDAGTKGDSGAWTVGLWVSGNLVGQYTNTYPF